MAKRTQRGASTVTEYPIAQAVGEVLGGSWHSIPRSLAKINHRLYREHRNYYAQVDLVSNVDQPTPIQVYTLAPTWYVLGALRAAKKVYDKAMREERATIKQARWHDFRCDIAGDATALGGGIAEALPYGLNQAGNPAFHTADELVAAKVADATGLQRCFNLVQPTGTVTAVGTAFNVFQEYDAMADTPVDNPAVGTPSPYDDLMAELDTENMTNLQYRGDLPPYNGDSFDAYWIKVGELYQTAGGAQSLSTGLFQAPLGLLYLYGYGTAMAAGPTLPLTESRLQVSVVPGGYKGVHSDAL